MIIDIIFSRLIDIIFSRPSLSAIGAVVTYLLASMIAHKIQKDFSNHLKKYDLVISLGIIFIGIYLLFLVLPFLREVASIRAAYPERPDRGEFQLDWFETIMAVSLLSVLIIYLLGTYTTIKLLLRNRETGRGLYFWTIGLFLFAFWMFVIFHIVFGI